MMSATRLLEVNDLSKSFGGLVVMNRLSFSLEEGETLGIIGPNGSGKSTLGKLIKGLLSPLSGQILIDGQALKPGEIPSRVGYVFSNPENQIVSTVVEEDVAFGLENMGMDPARIRLRVAESLTWVGMEAYRHHSPHLLSGGQQQKVVLAGILAMGSEVLVLDEPTSMLDPGQQKEILNLLRKIQERGKKTVLHITHSVEEALGAQDLVVLNRGRVSFYGPAEDFFFGDRRPEWEWGEMPRLFRLIQGLRRRRHPIPAGVRSIEELKRFLLDRKG